MNKPDRFDEVAHTWDEKPDRMVMAEKFAGEIVRSLHGKVTDSAMEYGCGTGNVSFQLNGQFKHIVLADSSKGMLEVVKEKMKIAGYNHMEPLLLDLQKQNIERKFDVIFTLMAMHHVRDVEKVISVFGNVLKEGGSLMIGDLVTEDGDFHKFPENQDVHYGFDEDDLRDMLKKYKMKVIEYKLFHTLTKDHTGEVKGYPLFFLKAIKKD